MFFLSSIVRDLAKNLDTSVTFASSGVDDRGADMPLHDLAR
jgi:hypothetical protein